MPWNAGAAGPHRDLLGDLFTAIRKTTVHPGMYYSLYEWFNPIWKKDRPAYVADYMWPQMKDLITTYRPEVFWTDGDWDGPDTLWKSTQFLAWLYNESPVKDKIVTYDRWGAGIRFHHGGVYTPEYQPNADFEDHYFEESRGMGFSYGYNREEDSWDYNSTQSLVLQLIDKVSRGGNFLLDIGPDEHGKIPPIMEERLLEIGGWMKINSEAIYNTTRWRTASQLSAGQAVKECFFTYNAAHNDLYALLPKWPAIGPSGAASFTIHDLAPAAGTRIELLETHQPLNWHQQGSDCIIDLPVYDPATLKSAYAYVIKLFNTGTFTPPPVVTVSYPGKSIHPLITVVPQPGIKYFYTLDGTFPTESSSLYTDPFTVSKTATLKVRGYKQGTLPSAVAVLPLQVFEWTPALRPGKTMEGLHYTAYEGPSERLHSFRELSGLSPVGEGAVTGLSRKGLTRKENAGLVFDGYLKVPEDGLYTLYLTSDGSDLILQYSLDGKHKDPVPDNFFFSSVK
jgi:hypothetical protein